MKQIALLCLMGIAISSPLRSQAQDSVKFSYDASGNRISRLLILGGGGSKGSENNDLIKPEITEEQLKGDNFYDQIGDHSILVYPNPAKYIVNVEIKGYEETENGRISIFDQTGKLLLTKTSLTGTNSISMAHFSSGVYFMVIQLNSGNARWTIIKE